MEDISKGVQVLARSLRSATELGPKAQGRASSRTKSIIAHGGAPAFRVTDWLRDSGLPMDTADRWQDLCPLAGVEAETLFWRPRATASRASGGLGLSLMALAALAVHLARWGFALDPTPLVEAATPTIKGKKLLTRHELDLLWWPREGAAMRDLITFSAPMPDAERGVIIQANGFVAAVHAGGLVIASPRISKRKWSDTLHSLKMTRMGFYGATIRQ